MGCLVCVGVSGLGYYIDTVSPSPGPSNRKSTRSHPREKSNSKKKVSVSLFLDVGAFFLLWILALRVVSKIGPGLSRGVMNKVKTPQSSL